MSSIGLNAEMLGEELAAGQELDRSEARELVAAIGAEVERLRELTEGYLARTRPDQGSLQEFDLAALVREIVEFLRPELDRRGVTVTIAAQPLALVHGDTGGMRQVLWNLLRNAWEAQQRWARSSAKRASSRLSRLLRKVCSSASHGAARTSRPMASRPAMTLTT